MAVTRSDLEGAGRVVAVGGVGVRLRAAGELAAAALGTVAAQLPPHAAGARVEIRCGAQAPATPSRRADRADGPLLMWWQGEELLLRHGDSVAGRVRDASADWGGIRADLALAYHQLFPFSIAHLLAPLSRFVLHAAAVQREGRAVLVLGASGSGKSTVTLAAMRHGWRVLSDDLVVVRTGPDGPEISGIARPLSVPADVAAGEPPSVRGGIADARDRRHPAVDDWDRGWHRVAAIVVTDHGHAISSELAPLGRADLLQCLLISHLARDLPSRRRGFIPAAAALSRRPGHRLQHSRDATRRLGGAAALLHQVAEAGREL